MNNKIRTAIRRAYRFKVKEYRDTMIYLVAGGLGRPYELKRGKDKSVH